ncbi:MAG: recombination regulator RecX [Sulfuricella sp.]|nr:recombination regulator RecX [Sulfuricella sp.]
MANDAMTIRERALAYLARREHTRAELARKLAPYCEERGEIDALLDDFTRHGWLSEERYADMLVTARQGKYGSRRIVHELREKGVSEEGIAAVLPEVRENELETARAVWAKKFGTPPADAKEKAKQMRFLAGRGFGQEIIFKILKGVEES